MSGEICISATFVFNSTGDWELPDGSPCIWSFKKFNQMNTWEARATAAAYSVMGGGGIRRGRETGGSF